MHRDHRSIHHHGRRLLPQPRSDVDGQAPVPTLAKEAEEGSTDAEFMTNSKYRPVSKPTFRRREIPEAYLVSKRFAALLDEKTYIHEDQIECHIWTGCRDYSGYGIMTLPKPYGYRIRLTRAVWAKRNGPIPNDMMVCHKCDNPTCLNIDHLFLGTAEDNAYDAIRKGRVPFRQSRGINTELCT